MFALETSDPCAAGQQICEAALSWTGNDTVAEIADIVIGKPLALVGLLVLGLVLRWVLHRIIGRVVLGAGDGVLPEQVSRFSFRHGKTSTPTTARDQIASARRVQRAQTIGDLLKSIVTGVLTAIVGTMMLSELGVNIAPIIASAGIIGVALGFGAQSLVKDFLSGIFMIFEDQYGVGDVVDVGEAIGTIEAVSLRVTRLRSIDGTVWYVPNGEILRVGNKSQNWSRAVIDVGVGYGEDLVKVTRVLHEVADSLQDDEDWAPLMIEEPEVTGVESLAADSIDLRVMIKTVPLKQWKIEREMRQRIKARFDQEGIEIPFAQRVVWHREQPNATPEESTPAPE